MTVSSVFHNDVPGTDGEEMSTEAERGDITDTEEIIMSSLFEEEEGKTITDPEVQETSCVPEDTESVEGDENRLEGEGRQGDPPSSPLSIEKEQGRSQRRGRTRRRVRDTDRVRETETHLSFRSYCFYSKVQRDINLWCTLGLREEKRD